MALLTLIAALVTALLSLVNAVGVLLVNGKRFEPTRSFRPPAALARQSQG